MYSYDERIRLERLNADVKQRTTAGFGLNGNPCWAQQRDRAREGARRGHPFPGTGKRHLRTPCHRGRAHGVCGRGTPGPQPGGGRLSFLRYPSGRRAGRLHRAGVCRAGGRAADLAQGAGLTLPTRTMRVAQSQRYRCWLGPETAAAFTKPS